eukprot:CAMPEP_0177584340 /NCGR_PEP_ID=MMETSP0419_2-20121207/3841_1 /TAXON_ID=582737 /ORGANISM="Tetraselmis sp., Strain GSL018" /LENGTH=88 /DNA_ID=CAMNT_0019073867 /DNA_START=403 /DNA_END=669 /DNA_ORIENTATION=+
MKRSGSQLMHVVLREDPGVADDPEDELRDGLQPAPVLAAADVIDAHHRRKELGSAPDSTELLHPSSQRGMRCSNPIVTQRVRPANRRS